MQQTHGFIISSVAFVVWPTTRRPFTLRPELLYGHRPREGGTGGSDGHGDSRSVRPAPEHDLRLILSIGDYRVYRGDRGTVKLPDGRCGGTRIRVSLIVVRQSRNSRGSSNCNTDPKCHSVRTGSGDSCEGKGLCARRAHSSRLGDHRRIARLWRDGRSGCGKSPPPVVPESGRSGHSEGRNESRST